MLMPHSAFLVLTLNSQPCDSAMCLLTRILVSGTLPLLKGSYVSSSSLHHLNYWDKHLLQVGHVFLTLNHLRDFPEC